MTIQLFIKFFISSLWRRLTLVVSSLWLLIGSAIYIRALGWCTGECTAYDSFPSLLSWWAIVCAKSGIPIFNFYHPPLTQGRDLISQMNTFELNFSIAGFTIYILGPILFIWLVVIGLEWAAEPNKKYNE